jgi:hypothetical protein
MRSNQNCPPRKRTRRDFEADAKYIVIVTRTYCPRLTAVRFRYTCTPYTGTRVPTVSESELNNPER